jgi:hypothetical protein
MEWTTPRKIMRHGTLLTHAHRCTDLKRPQEGTFFEGVCTRDVAHDAEDVAL